MRFCSCHFPAQNSSAGPRGFQDRNSYHAAWNTGPVLLWLSGHFLLPVRPPPSTPSPCDFHLSHTKQRVVCQTLSSPWPPGDYPRYSHCLECPLHPPFLLPVLLHLLSLNSRAPLLWEGLPVSQVDRGLLLLPRWNFHVPKSAISWPARITGFPVGLPNRLSSPFRYGHVLLLCAPTYLTQS